MATGATNDRPRIRTTPGREALSANPPTPVDTSNAVPIPITLMPANNMPGARGSR